MNCYDSSQTSTNCGGVPGLTAANNGNRWLASSSGLPSPSLEVPTTPNAYLSGNNRIGGFNYDAAGNVLDIPATNSLRHATYDAENRMKTMSLASGDQATYDYDGDGRRVKKTVTPSGAAAITTVFVYDPMGQLTAEFGSANDAGTRYLTADHLGSTRLITKQDGSVDRTYDYLPFGEEYSPVSPIYPQLGGPNSIKFTSKERDAETGLDYFEARYLSSAQGRFTSPDEFPGGIVDPFTGQQVSQPGPLPYADITDPQTLNKYGYVRNNPLRYTDPDGHCIEDFCIGEAILVGAAAGGIGGVIVQKVSDFFTGHESSKTEIGAAFVSGAIVGGTGGAAAPLSIPLQAAAVGSAGVIGGVAERGIKTGSLDKATQNPADFAKDFAAAAVSNAVAGKAAAVATTSERGAVESLSAQQGRTTTMRSLGKVTERLQSAYQRLNQKAAVTGAVAGTTFDATRTAVEKQKRKSCSSELEGCH